MIEAEKLTKRYRPVTAVDGLTFTARPGHVTGFLGPNGAGGAPPYAATRQMKVTAGRTSQNHVCHR